MATPVWEVDTATEERGRWVAGHIVALGKAEAEKGLVGNRSRAKDEDAVDAAVVLRTG